MQEAKRRMLSIDVNRDVFITQNGRSDEPVLGLITDRQILNVINE